MSDPVVRAIVVVAIVSLVLVAAGAARRGALVRRRPIRLPYQGVVLFASDGCEACATVRSNLAAAGISDVTVIDWDESPERFLAAGIDRVPTIAKLGEDGRGWAVEGIPSAGRLRRWLGDP